MVAADLSSKLKRTKICKFWVFNRCTLGEACTFAHSTCDLQEQPDLVKTELCFQFMSKGQCKRGAACTFAHGKKELRKPRKEMPKSAALAHGKMSAEAQECLSETEVKPEPVAPPSEIFAELHQRIEHAESALKGVNAMVMHINLMSHSVPNTFRPPPGLPPPECLKEDDADTASTTASTQSSTPSTPREKSEPASPTNQIFWL
ncbi:unnamed protein product [Durusdinium trenchii]|uniref:Zinc finger protein zfs1 (Multicopy suppressor of overexpressed cyr1 protein 4) n=2 Tax=Durusdinium trenchii TaxID=1381693 RepID=A0ABP0PXK1_9DINO